jgi:xanthine dehydrogenase accessory factor
MRDVLEEIDGWLAAGEDVALATVVATWGSAPRGPGSKMAVSSSGRIAGSVSGGCVEGAVAEEAQQVLAKREARLVHFGVADETAWSVGLACGGKIDVLVAPLDTGAFDALRTALIDNRAAATATVVSGPAGSIGTSLLLVEGTVTGGASIEAPEAVVAARLALADGRCRRVSLSGLDLFVDVILPPPTLVVVGAVHIAVALVSIARSVGYRTVVVDPRAAFGNRERFPHADELRNEWPDAALRTLGLHAGTAVAVLTHDPKIDDPALETALPSAAFYVGALGSKTTHEKRRKRLIDAGLTEPQVERLHAPIGLDLGGRRPEEIALAVMAQIVAARNGRDGG